MCVHTCTASTLHTLSAKRFLLFLKQNNGEEEKSLKGNFSFRVMYDGARRDKAHKSEGGTRKISAFSDKSDFPELTMKRK